MQDRYARVWPDGLPFNVSPPVTTLSENLDVSALRFPARPATIFYGEELCYPRLHEEVGVMAGYLQQACAVGKGDRVLLMGQSCPQFVISYYAILRAGAVVVALNVMSTADEISYAAADAGARVGICARELHERFTKLDDQQLERIVVFDYADYLSGQVQANTYKCHARLSPTQL